MTCLCNGVNFANLSTNYNNSDAFKILRPTFWFGPIRCTYERGANPTQAKANKSADSLN
jgi:hypothetical protein